MQYRAVLFDKDGTLLDFHATWGRVFRHAAEQLERESDKPGLAEELLIAGGLDPRTGQFDAEGALACEATPTIAQTWAQAAGVQDADALAEQLESLFGMLQSRRLVPVPGLSQAVEQLHGGGLVLGLATMDSEAMAHADLDALGVRRWFSFACGADSGFGYKPNPGMVEAVCSAVDQPATATVMVGDTPHDLRMGRNAGVGLVVGVLTGAASESDLQPLADVVLPGVASLPSLLL